MKYIVILGDGMADEPIAEIGGKTPLMYAKTPVLDGLAPKSEVGLAHTIPEGMKPGSDTANLAVLGYDPMRYYTGRSPLEALSIGVPMKDTDIAIRCNMVTVSDDSLPYEEKTIIDHSSGEISTEDAAVLLDAVKEELNNDSYQYYVGTSYRHLMIWDHGEVAELTPPHDVLGQVIGEHLPADGKLREMMKRSYDILNNHPINIERAKKGLNKANSIWFWGAGTKPALDSFEGKYGKKGAMISAVDLLKGIAVGAQMTNIEVDGADGTLETNWEGKADAAVKAVLEDGFDFVYIHMEAPDEMGHQGSLERKIKAIEYLDGRVLAKVVEKMDQSGEDYRMLIMPDHPTPIACRTHTADPVPYMLYDSRINRKNSGLYNEKDARANGIIMEHGFTLMSKLLEK
ncbi:MAG: cofactor-independent phosphoglycerate mutase [Lachnospiraceae bacterium]|jgi:2,3-bisphosphoglycerate-independent phosphoglycerate mutase|nr:cofactor-independent phosphoglycerate mutase [Lachnospiraceae bacterium]